MSTITYHCPISGTSPVACIEQWEIKKGHTHYFFIPEGNSSEPSAFTVALWRFKNKKQAQPKVIDCRYVTGHDLDKF